MNKPFTIIVSGLVILATGAFIVSRQPQKASALDGFAQCLTQKGVTMYGAYWCSHCQNEKRAFGDAFKYVTYVECTENPKACTDVGVKGYPTWTLPDGTKLEGEQGIVTLSKATGCALPESR